MSVSYADNAVLAKAHAMYGKRLTKSNYEDMLNCRSLGELANYLKTRTYFSTDFEALPTSLSAVQIEELLKISLLKKCEKLCEYQLSVGEGFYKYYIVQNDIRQIMTVIRLLIAGKPENYLSSLPPFFNSRTEIDLYALARVRSFSDLLSVLEHTEYAKILERYKNNYADDGVYVLIENSLNKFLFSFLMDSVKACKDRRRKKEIYEIVSYRFDMYTLTRAYRLLSLGFADKFLLDDFIIRENTNFSEKDLEVLASSKSSADVVRLIPTTYYKKDFAKINFSYIEKATQEMLVNKLTKGLRYYTNPTAVMLSYLFLAENEIKNITHIVEAVKYNIPTNKTDSVLIGI